MEKKTYLFCGHHKGGTVWSSKIFAAICRQMGLRGDYFNSPKQFSFDLVRHIAERNLDFVCYANADAKYLQDIGNYRGFHIIRDPRDTVVSGYFSHRNSHPTKNWPELVSHRQRLLEMSKEDGLMLEIDFSAALPTDGINLDQFEALRTWDFRNPDMLELKFEDITVNPIEGFRTVFDFLGLRGEDSAQKRLSDQDLARIIAENDFATFSGGRTPGNEDASSHYRKGVANDWKNHFDSRVKDYFKERFGDLLIQLGYEANHDW